MDPIHEARVERLFLAYDPDHDGYMTLQNFTDHVYKLAAMYGESADEAHYQGLIRELKAWWDQMAGMVDTDHDGRINRDEIKAFAASLTPTMQQMSAANAPWPLDPWINTLYKVIDQDEDGHLTLEEYRNWLKALGIDKDMDVETIFHSFDKNRHGYLSRDEFAKVSRQFWMDFDPQVPGHRWIGP